MTDTRDRILDAAVAVMREEGLGRATTRLIAREAGFSEATLYKHFKDKHDLFLAVLTQRLPPLADAIDRLPGAVGTGSVGDNLAVVTRAAIDFYAEGFPIFASLFGEQRLFDDFKAELTAQGAGPHIVRERVAAYVRAEAAAGRLRPGTDGRAVSALLMGAAFQQAFLTHFPMPAPLSDLGPDRGADLKTQVDALVATALAPHLPG